MIDRPTEPPTDRPRQRRTVAVILGELADVERHLEQAPPHSDRGVRDRLEARRTSLQRELVAARRQGG